MKSETESFKELCIEYLNRLSIMDLRSYGRFLNLPAPTRLKKMELIYEIIGVLCGEKNPSRTKKGAPIKNTYFQTEIPLQIEQIRKKVWGKETTSFQTTEEEQETDINNNTIQLKFSVHIERLNETQKQLLNAFLKSL